MDWKTPRSKKIAYRLLFVAVTCAAIPLSQAEDQTKLYKECFRQNKGRSCVRLGTTLWQTPAKRTEARAAFTKGCELKIESACTLKEMGVSTSDQAKPVADASSGIEKTGPSSYKVSRGTVMKYAQNLDETLSTAKMVTSTTKSGEAQGYRFKSIDKDSVFAALGFQQNDIITQVNEQKIVSPTDAMNLLPTLLYGATSQYDVQMIRGGQPLTQKFQIVE
jgi:hypothetical protein